METSCEAKGNSKAKRGNKGNRGLNAYNSQTIWRVYGAKQPLERLWTHTDAEQLCLAFADGKTALR